MLKVRLNDKVVDFTDLYITYKKRYRFTVCCLKTDELHVIGSFRGD